MDKLPPLADSALVVVCLGLLSLAVFSFAMVKFQVPRTLKIIKFPRKTILLETHNANVTMHPTASLHLNLK